MRGFRPAAVSLGKFFLLFLLALTLPALLAPAQPLVGMLVLVAGLSLVGLYGRRVRRQVGF